MTPPNKKSTPLDRYHRVFPSNLPPFSFSQEETGFNQIVIKRELFPFPRFVLWQLLLRDLSWPGVTWSTRAFCRCVSIVKDGLNFVRWPAFLKQSPLEPWTDSNSKRIIPSSYRQRDSEEGDSYSVYPQSYKCRAKGLFAHRYNLLLTHLTHFF